MSTQGTTGAEPFPVWYWADRSEPAHWTVVWLRPEATVDEGSFLLTDKVRAGEDGTYPVALYQPDRSGTHTPLGEAEMAELGLRPAVPHPDENGEWPE